MKLELKHLAPYLPYKLNVYRKSENDVYPMSVNNNTVSLKKGINVDDLIYNSKEYKPILRPLSDLTKLIDEDVRNVKYYRMLSSCYSESDLRNFQTVPIIQRYDDVQILLSYHFDVFGLIEKGLGIDINTLNDKL